MSIELGFFFQAEDGIRDGRVTGVQTCALPISHEIFGGALYNPLQCAGGQIYDESWASFRGGNWRGDFWLGGGGNSGGSRNSSRGVRAEHAAVRQDRRWPAALARRAAQTGIRPNRRAHEEVECVFHSLYQARPRF